MPLDVTGEIGRSARQWLADTHARGGHNVGFGELFCADDADGLNGVRNWCRRRGLSLRGRPDRCEKDTRDEPGIALHERVRRRGSV